MDKILSARVEESVLSHIGNLAHRLHTTKKRIIEDAIQMYAAKMEKDQNISVLKETCGVWKRKDSADKTVKKARKAFRQSMVRHHL